MSQPRKVLYWEGSSKKNFKEFPIGVQKDMGVALFVVQLGGTPGSAKPWKGLGPGVYELGIATPQPDVALIEQRMKVVLARQRASRRT